MAQLHWLSGRKITDSAGAAYALAKAYFYVTGTTTLQDTYTTAALSVANTNPVVADANGVFGPIYLAAKRYKLTVKTAADVTISEYSFDPIDAVETMIVSASAPSPTYPLMRYANSTDGHTYRRKLDDSDWVDEGLTDTLLNAASVAEVRAGTGTTKSVTPDSLAAIWQRGTDITPSAGAISIPSTGGKHFNLIAGNFASCSSASGGTEFWLHAQGVSVVTHDATSMECDGSANVTTAAGDILILVNKAATDVTGANYRVHVIKKTGSPVSITDLVTTQTLMEAKANNATAVTPLAMKWHPGVAKASGNIDGTGTVNERYSDGLSGTTDNGAGDYTANKTTAMSSANYAYSIVSGSGTGTNVIATMQSSANPTTTALRWNANQVSVGAFDTDQVGVAFLGDE